MPHSMPEESIAKLPNRKIVSQPKIREKLMGCELQAAHCSSADEGGFINSIATNQVELVTNTHTELKPHGFSKVSVNSET